MFEVKWLVENRVILHRSVGDQTKESIMEGLDEMYKLYAMGEAPVHLLNDSRYVGRYPTNIENLKKMMIKPENGGEVIIVGASPIVKYMTKLLVSLVGNNKPQFCNSIAEGIALLKVTDMSLPDEIYCDEQPAI